MIRFARTCEGKLRRVLHTRGATLLFALALGGCAQGLQDSVDERVADLPLPSATPRVLGAAETASAREQAALVAAFGGEYRFGPAQAALNELTDKLGPATDRPGDRYHVTMLNSPVVNAFALANGAVFVTRGLLVLANDTSEVAAVLAHEIAHVTARHAAERAELERRSALVSRVAEEVLNNPVASQAKREQGKVAIASFSRQQEFEADGIAVRTTARAGYDPYGESRFLTSLGRSTAVRAAMAGMKGAQGPDIAATHPSTPERIQLAVLAARQIGAPGLGDGDRNRWLAAVNGMTFGEDPSEGLVRGRRFLHPRLGFTFTAPEGFTLENNQQAVIGLAAANTRALRFDAVKATPGAPLDKLLQDGLIDGVKTTDIETLTINGLPAATGLARGQEWTFRLFAIRLGTQVYRLIFASSAFSPEVDAGFREAGTGFRRLSAEEIAAIKPARIAIATMKEGEGFQDLAERMTVGGGEDRMQRLLVLNGLDPDAKPVAGQRYKVVVE